jgi:hypothetical protein
MDIVIVRGQGVSEGGGHSHVCLGLRGRVWMVLLLALRGKTAHGGGYGSRSPPSQVVR